MADALQIGSKVYLRNCIAGDPGIVREISHGMAKVDWPDMPEVGRTKHRLDALVEDESFVLKDLAVDFEQTAA